MNLSQNKILLVEDDPSFGYILKEYLHLHEFDITWIKNGAEALETIRQNEFDLLILDISLPGLTGLEIAEELKNIRSETPFIFLTARSLKIDKLKGYRSGCDDYEVKPVDEEILLAKIQAIINRKNRVTRFSTEPQVYSLGKYLFSPSTQCLQLGSEIKKLTRKETELLELLYHHKNLLVERKYILKQIWGIADLFSRKSMDVFITRLRKYLSSDDAIQIVNVHNRGFILRMSEID